MQNRCIEEKKTFWKLLYIAKPQNIPTDMHSSNEYKITVKGTAWCTPSKRHLFHVKIIYRGPLGFLYAALWGGKTWFFFFADGLDTSPDDLTQTYSNMRQTESRHRASFLILTTLQPQPEPEKSLQMFCNIKLTTCQSSSLGLFFSKSHYCSMLASLPRFH